MAGMVLLLILASAAVRVPPAPPIGRPGDDPLRGISDQGRCTLLREAAERANRRMPVTGTNGLKAIAMTMDCAARAQETRFTVSGPYAANAEKIRQATTERTRKVVCDGELSGPLARRGWRFTSRYTFSDGRDLVIQTTCR